MTYNTNIKLECAGDPNGNRVPGQVLLRVREGHKGDGRPRCSCYGDEDSSGEQTSHDDLLPPRQLHSTNIWNRDQHNEQIHYRVDAPGRE